MIVRRILGAHAFRKVDPAAFAHIFRPDFIVALHEQFGFVDLPVAPTQVLGENLDFKYGKVQLADRAIIVREFRVAPEWVTATVDTSTDDAELALKEIADWATDKFKISPQPPRGAYASQLEVQLDFHFGLAFPQLAQLGAGLSKSLVDSRGQRVQPFEVISIGMNVDPGIVTTPTQFIIERRAGFAYQENTFFSQAPLRTQDHIALLEEFEGAMKALETLRIPTSAQHGGS